MKAWDYEACVYKNEVRCMSCLPRGVDEDEVHPIFAADEFDYYPVCDKCGTVHDYVALTEFGQREYEAYRKECRDE